MNKTVPLYLAILFITLYFTLGILTERYFISYEDNLANYDYKTNIGCDTDSMGLTVGCHDIAFGNKVDQDDRLYPGYIYVYNGTNSSNDTIHVIHRLVYCLDDDCNVSIFKGDNNFVAEIVNRSDILYSVDAVRYR